MCVCICLTQKTLETNKAEKFPKGVTTATFFGGVFWGGGMGDNVHFSGSNAYANATMLICSSCRLVLFCSCLSDEQLVRNKKVNTTGGSRAPLTRSES